jgi:NitT/TauT family transport system substrate-binding protein
MKKAMSPMTVVLTLCLLAGCFHKPAPKKPLRIGLDQWPGYAYAFVAREKGFFKKHGIDVELVFNRSYAETKTLYENGDIDGYFGVFADAVLYNAEGMPTTVVYVVDNSVSGDAIIGRPACASVSDLKGKTVGIERLNSFSHIFVLTALEKIGGLHERDIRLATVPAHEVLTALEEGKIDAGHTWEPTKSRALKKGYKVLCTADDVPGVIIDVLAFRAGVVKERASDVQAVVAALVEARNYVVAREDEAFAIMARAEGMDTEEIAEGIRGAHLCDLAENRAMMKPSSGMLSESGRMIAQFHMNRGQISVMPDVDDHIDERFVNAAPAGGEDMQ